MVNAQSVQKTQARNEWQAKQKRKGVKINIRHEKKQIKFGIGDNDFTWFENKSLNKKSTKAESIEKKGDGIDKSLKLFLYMSGLEKATILKGQMECACVTNTAILAMYRCVVP